MTSPNEPTMPTGHELLQEMEQRCESLRQWHADVNAELNSRREKLADYAQTLEDQRLALEAEREKLTAEQNDLAADREQLLELRADLDDEWAGLRKLRQTYEKVGKELDTERQRINRKAFKFPAAGKATKKAA